MSYIRARRSREGGGVLPGFLVGCLAMLVLGAVHCCWRRSAITRRRIRRRAGAARDGVIEKVEDLMVHRSEEGADAGEETAS